MNSTTEMNATQPTTLRVRRILRTDEERRAYMDEKYPNRPTCCFCKKKVECPYGNNPAPLANRGKCCGECNQVVIFVRIGLIPLDLAKKNKKNLKELYAFAVGFTEIVADPEPEPEPVPVPLPALEKTEEEQYEADHSIARAFEERYAERVSSTPNLHICFDNAEMEEVVSKDKAVVLRQETNCYCYSAPPVGFLPQPEIKTIPVPYEGRPITKRDCCEAIVKSNWKCCNHLFLEGFARPNENGEVVLVLGS